MKKEFLFQSTTPTNNTAFSNISRNSQSLTPVSKTVQPNQAKNFGKHIKRYSMFQNTHQNNNSPRAIATSNMSKTSFGDPHQSTAQMKLNRINSIYAQKLCETLSKKMLSPTQSPRQGMVSDPSQALQSKKIISAVKQQLGGNIGKPQRIVQKPLPK